MDLAGNERADRTGNTGQRMEESKAINKSLFNLQACLRELRWNQQNAADKEPRNVPYRASKVDALWSPGTQAFIAVCTLANACALVTFVITELRDSKKRA